MDLLKSTLILLICFGFLAWTLTLFFKAHRNEVLKDYELGMPRVDIFKTFKLFLHNTFRRENFRKYCNGESFPVQLEVFRPYPKWVARRLNSGKGYY